MSERKLPSAVVTVLLMKKGAGAEQEMHQPAQTYIQVRMII